MAADGERDPQTLERAVSRRALGWTALLGLVSAAAGCHLMESEGRPDYPPDHPCYRKGNCEYFLQLDDGGAAEPADGAATSEVPDGGRLRMCGPCNG